MKEIGLLLTIITIIVGIIIGYYLAIITDYNDGVCSQCGGHWELFDIEKDTDSFYSWYYYKCDNCSNILKSFFSLE